MSLKALFTSSGRRVELIEIFKIEGFTAYAADCDPTAPTLFAADKKFIVPRVLDNPVRYIDALLEIVKAEEIDVIIPLIDTELTTLAGARDEFQKHGAEILISAPEAISIAFDKYRTYRFFESIGLPTPPTYLADDLAEDQTGAAETIFPALLKPRFGSAGQGIMACDDMEHFSFLHSRRQLINYIIQRKVTGEEITTDIFGDGGGGMIAAVQRQRLKIRGGEVERGITVKYPQLLEHGRLFTRHYQPYGTVNIQCFYDNPGGEAYYIEINPRFGGGYPLAYNAGANFPAIIRKLLNEEVISSEDGDYREGLLMSRYDRAVYFEKGGNS
jgi:carbamoyl-phosphate synthase large subunit